MKFLPKSLHQKLLQREQNNALRQLVLPNNLVDFSSNDYLGLAKSEEIFQQTDDLLVSRNYKVNGATGSRLLTGNHSIYTETEEQIVRLEEVFKIIGKKATAKKCDAMEGLIEEAKGMLEETELGVVRDAGIIAASQKIEHYEIATYGTLRQFAETLGLPEAATLLEQTLDEEKGADKILTEVAVNAVNLEAAEIESLMRAGRA